MLSFIFGKAAMEMLIDMGYNDKSAEMLFRISDIGNPTTAQPKL